MTKDSDQEQAPGKSGAEERRHKALPSSLLADATPGNRLGLAEAYGYASAWLREGRVPPEELAKWLGERLLALANVLHDDHDKKLHGVNAALGLTAAGKRGRKPATDHDLSLMSFLAWDAYYERRTSSATWDEIFDKVAARTSAARTFVTPTQVESAWKARKRVAPEIPEMDS